MESRQVGSSGVRISRIGLGGYQLGPEPGEIPDVDRGVEVVRAALEHAIDWLDTSENYLDTNNETLIGEVLARVDGEFLVASKAAPEPGVTGGGSGFRPEQIRSACRASLRRLGRDYIDVYFLHWPDKSGVPLEETWGAMAELADEGLVRAIGLSNYTPEDVERCHAHRRVDAVQDGLSMIDYVDDRTAFARYGELGISVTIFEPLASGVLSGKTVAQVRGAWTGAWEDTDFYRKLADPVWESRCTAFVQALRPIADRLGVTVSQLAIAWVLHQPGVTAAIVGSGSGRHMAENADGADVRLDEVLSELEVLIPLGPNVVS